MDMKTIKKLLLNFFHFVEAMRCRSKEFRIFNFVDI